jgi:hypothetical protein
MTDILKPTPIYILDGEGQREPVAPKWTVKPWPKSYDKYYRNFESPALFKLDDSLEYNDFDILNDLLFGALGDDVAFGTWAITTQEGLERLKLLFRVLGVDEYLTICEHPDRAIPFEPKHTKAGIRAKRQQKNDAA